MSRNVGTCNIPNSCCILELKSKVSIDTEDTLGPPCDTSRGQNQFSLWCNLYSRELIASVAPALVSRNKRWHSVKYYNISLILTGLKVRIFLNKTDFREFAYHIRCMKFHCLSISEQRIWLFAIKCRRFQGGVKAQEKGRRKFSVTIMVMVMLNLSSLLNAVAIWEVV